MLRTYTKILLFLFSVVVQYGVAVRDCIQENKMLRNVYEREKDKFGGTKG